MTSSSMEVNQTVSQSPSALLCPPTKDNGNRAESHVHRQKVIKESKIRRQCKRRNGQQQQRNELIANHSSSPARRM